MRHKSKCAKDKLGAVRYAEYMGDISREEADEIRAVEIARIYKTARLVR